MLYHLSIVQSYQDTFVKILSFINSNSKTEIAAVLGLTPMGLYKKRKNPGQFSLDELELIAAHFQVDAEPIRAYIVLLNSLDEIITKSGWKRKSISERLGITKGRLDVLKKKPLAWKVQEVEKLLSLIA